MVPIRAQTRWREGGLGTRPQLGREGGRMGCSCAPSVDANLLPPFSFSADSLWVGCSGTCPGAQTHLNTPVCTPLFSGPVLFR